MPFPLLPVPTSLAPLLYLFANRFAQFLALSSPRLTGCITSEPYRSTLSASPRPTDCLGFSCCSLSTSQSSLFSFNLNPPRTARPFTPTFVCAIQFLLLSPSPSYTLYILPLSLATSRSRLFRYFLDLQQCDQRATTARPKPHYPALINNPKSILHLSGNVNLGQPILTRTVQRRPSRTNTDRTTG